MTGLAPQSWLFSCKSMSQSVLFYLQHSTSPSCTLYSVIVCFTAEENLRSCYHVITAINRYSFKVVKVNKQVLQTKATYLRATQKKKHTVWEWENLSWLLAYHGSLSMVPVGFQSTKKIKNFSNLIQVCAMYIFLYLFFT